METTSTGNAGGTAEPRLMGISDPGSKKENSFRAVLTGIRADYIVQLELYPGCSERTTLE